MATSLIRPMCMLAETKKACSVDADGKLLTKRKMKICTTIENRNHV